MKKVLLLGLLALVGCDDAEILPQGPGCEDGLDVNADGFCDRTTVDWTAQVRLEPGTHRGDLFGLGDALPGAISEGLGHAQVWPVDVSGILLPYDSLTRALDPEQPDETLQGLRRLAGQIVGFETMPGMYDWLGLPAYNASGAGPFGSPHPIGVQPQMPMGVAVIDSEWGPALTFSCTACHAGRLLGRTVMGLANRQSRANEFFNISLRVLPSLDTPVIRDALGTTEGQSALIARAMVSADNVVAKKPQALGLDTSLAQVALSLARRGDDPYATPDAERSANPPAHPLDSLVADSKPMAWWTMKYKTRWLSDGSIVAGNPVFTNFLWNELGRGTDLRALEGWMQSNRRAIDTLTAAVFASEAPRWTDYFDASTIDLAAAQRGQAVFEARCASCHGVYEKAWDASDAAQLEPAARLATTRVVYHAQTPVLDVGTDPNRAQAMATFSAKLNGLAISQWMQTVIEPQTGYVPPPLNGIWARYPYLHNNSVPTLCALLTPPADRPETFRQGPSESEADFDADCVGYPVGDAIPAEWADVRGNLVDTTRPGLSNAGHSAMFDGTDGPALTAEGRSDLIAFLKTL
jgi:mono/diheme cytochrome c family protein